MWWRSPGICSGILPAGTSSWWRISWTPATLYFLEGYLKAKGAESITIVTLLDKPSRREKPITPDLAGFEVPDEFVVGFGLDYCQQYRNMPYIGVLKPEVYSK